MALILRDRVKETTTTTGTGTVTLAGAVAGFGSFASIENANTTYYTITDGTNWEVGIGTYTASGTTLSRDTVLSSSNAGALVNFPAGTKEVFCTQSAERTPVANPLTFNNGGSGAASGSAYNASTAMTVSHNTIGALGLTGGTLSGNLTVGGSTNPTITLKSTNAGGSANGRVQFVDSADTVIGYIGDTSASDSVLDISGTAGVNVYLGTGAFNILANASGNTGIIVSSATATNTYVDIWQGGTYRGYFGYSNSKGALGIFGGTSQAIIFDTPNGVSLQHNGTTRLATSSTGVSVTGTLGVSSATNLAASTVSAPSMNMPHGTAPSSPTNGDMWTTTAGLFARINGATVGPFGTGGGTTTNAITFNNSGAGAASGTTFDGSAARTISTNTIGAVPTGAVTTSGLTMTTGRLLARTTAATGAIEEFATLPTTFVPAFTGGDVTSAGGSLTLTIGTNAVTNAKFRQSAGLSIVGRSANTTGDVADITGTANQVLRVSGTTLAFGSIDLSQSATVGSSILAVANGGTGASTLTGVVIGNGTSAFTVKTNPSGAFVGTTDTQTLTNKRIDPRVSSTTSISSPLAVNSDNFDLYAATAQSTAFTVNADTGTPVDGQKLILRVLDNGVARVITFTGGVSKGYRPVGVTLTVSGSNWTYTTTASKTVYFGMIYNAAASRWDITSLAAET